MRQDWRAGDPGVDHITVDEVRGHPRFEDAKAALIDGLAGLYLEDWRLRGLIEYERRATFMLIVSLDALRDPRDGLGGVPMHVLNNVLPTMGISPGRRIFDLAAKLRNEGLLEGIPAPHDGRVRLLRGTKRGMVADCEWIRVFHQPLTILRPEVDYRPALAHDLAYQRAFRQAGLGMLDIANEIMNANPPIGYFVKETVGFRVLMMLMQSIRGGTDGRSPAGFYSHAAKRGGMSRTHVKNVLTKAAEQGYVAFSERPGDYVEVHPAMIEAFDRWTAESLSSIDRVRAYAEGRG